MTVLRPNSHNYHCYIIMIIYLSNMETGWDLGPGFFTGVLAPRQLFPLATEYKETKGLKVNAHMFSQGNYEQ